MSRIAIPASIDAAPQTARPMLEGVKAQLGVAPNLFRLVAVNPAALEGYLGLFGALGKGLLPRHTRESLAIAVAEANNCAYCLSAHDYLGRNVAKLDDAEIDANRRGASKDPKTAAALRFALRVLERRGHVDDADIGAVRAAGYSDAEIVEIVLHVGMNVWTNYMNSVAKTDIDFPVVMPRAA
jgi:uncharacterized peroxidase-related enzyme